MQRKRREYGDATAVEAMAQGVLDGAWPAQR